MRSKCKSIGNGDDEVPTIPSIFVVSSFQLSYQQLPTTTEIQKQKDNNIKKKKNRANPNRKERSRLKILFVNSNILFVIVNLL